MTALLDAALGYAAGGWSVIPIVADKRPAVPWKRFQTERADARQIERWFRNGNASVTGVAVVLGGVSGDLAVRDFDAPDAYQRWAAQHAELAATLPTAKSARGFHVYGRCGGARTTTLGDGELRAGGSYVLAPPSLHPAGSRYQWTIPANGQIPTVPLSAFLPPGPPRSEVVIGEITELVTQEKQKDTQKQLSRPEIASVLSSVNPLSLFCNTAAVDDAIRRTLPQRAGQRNRALFHFARRIRAIRPDADEVFLRSVVRRWYDAALPTIETKNFDITVQDFTYAWDRVRFVPGCWLRQALAAADARPLPAIAQRYEEPLTRRVVGLCAELQRAAGDEPFFLACRSVATLFDIDHMTASRVLKMLTRDGVLAVAQAGTAARATRYRFIGGE